MLNGAIRDAPVSYVRLAYGHRNPLIIPRSAGGVIRPPQIEVFEETNNLVPESHEVNRVVTHSYQVNRAAKRYADSQTSLRVEPLHNSLRVTQNSTSSRGPVTYKNFVGQRLCGTQRPAQHNPESSWQFTALRGVTLFTEIKTLVLLWIRPPTVDQ